MRVESIPTMAWEDAPDTIAPKDLAAILGIGIEGARAIFDKDDFPKISKKDIGNIGKADKEAARLYIQGVKIKTNSKDALLSMIYFELKKLNSKINTEEENINENEGCKQEKVISKNIGDYSYFRNFNNNSKSNTLCQ